jgi:outer membrane protein TolC
MLSLAATALFAQEPTTATRATEPVSAETDRDANDARALRLTLDGALNTALQQNLGVQLQTYDFRITDQNLRARYGIFDFFTDANIRHSYSDNPTTNPFQPSGSRSTSVGAGLTQLLPTGGDYSVRWDSSRSTVAGGGTFVNPQYGNGLDFSFNQPLMRDFGIDITRRGITVARNNLGISEEAFRTAVMDTVSATEQAYLDLVYARRNVDVVKESLFLARDQARITQIRIDVGASAACAPQPAHDRLGPPNRSDGQRRVQPDHHQLPGVGPAGAGESSGDRPASPPDRKREGGSALHAQPGPAARGLHRELRTGRTGRPQRRHQRGR